LYVYVHVHVYGGRSGWLPRQETVRWARLRAAGECPGFAWPTVHVNVNVHVHVHVQKKPGTALRSARPLMSGRLLGSETAFDHFVKIIEVLANIRDRLGQIDVRVGAGVSGAALEQ
jgi:hypothetical protein